MKINPERIFGSTIRANLFIHFLGAAKRPYSFKEISRKLRIKSKKVLLKEIENLKRIDLVSTLRKDGMVFYQVNVKGFLYKELKGLVFKVAKPPEEKMFLGLRKTGDIKYALLTGFFTQARGVQTDILIVGRVNQKKLNDFIKRIEKQINREINYTIMTPNEYSYRTTAGDQFVNKIKKEEYIILIDTLKNQKKVVKK